MPSSLARKVAEDGLELEFGKEQGFSKGKLSPSIFGLNFTEFYINPLLGCGYLRLQSSTKSQYLFFSGVTKQK